MQGRNYVLKPELKKKNHFHCGFILSLLLFFPFNLILNLCVSIRIPAPTVSWSHCFTHFQGSFYHLLMPLRSRSPGYTPLYSFVQNTEQKRNRMSSDSSFSLLSFSNSPSGTCILSLPHSPSAIPLVRASVWGGEGPQQSQQPPKESLCSITTQVPELCCGRRVP